MKKKETFENLILPNQNKLIISDEDVSAEILDAEMDILNCSFHFDMSVQIDTKDLQYICLDLDNLEILKELIIKSEHYYEGYFNNANFTEDY